MEHDKSVKRERNKERKKQNEKVVSPGFVFAVALPDCMARKPQPTAYRLI